MNNLDHLDLLQQTETRDRWLVPAKTESIGEKRYSLWKSEEPRPLNLPRFSLVSLVSIPLTVVALLALAQWAVAGGVDRIQMAAGVVGALLIVGYIVAMALLSREARKQRGRGKVEAPEISEAPPTPLPKHAIPARASVGRRGSTYGWLWFDEDVLNFRGIDFDFSIRAADLRSSHLAKRLLRRAEGMRLQSPRKTLYHPLYITPGYFQDGKFRAAFQRWQEIESDMDTWAMATPGQAPSLLPPLRPVRQTRWKPTVKALVGPPLYMAFLLTLITIGLPNPTGLHRSPWTLPIGGLLFGAFFVLMMAWDASEDRTMDRQVDRLIEEAKRSQDV